MAASVQVLSPNGHRKNIKISPNTKILQILEEVCGYFEDFQPPEEYELKHGRKTLDLTLTVRYAGLSNHAKLELVKATKPRAESSVTLALQMVRTGQRLQGEYKPSTTLWEVIQDLAQRSEVPSGEEGTHPVIIYMREEVVGELALKETTLKKLGLTGGKAILRLDHRQVDESVLQEIQQEIEKEKAKRARLSSRSTEQQCSQESTPPVAAVTPSGPSATTEDPSTEQSGALQDFSESGVKTNVSENARTQETEPMDTECARDKDDLKDSVAMETDTSGLPSSAPETMETESSEPQPGPSHGGGGARPRTGAGISQLSDIPGVEVIQAGNIHLTPEEQQKARKLAQIIMPGVLPPPSQPLVQSQKKAKPQKPRQQQQQQQQPVFPLAEFKFPEETKDQELYRNELSDVRKEEFKPCDREMVVFNHDEAPKSPSRTEDDDLPDSFFEVTESDVRKMWADLQKKTSEEDPLMTSAMRQIQLENKMSKYSRVVIRVHFPDRLVLQGVFRTRETVFSLQKFVRDHLEDKNLPFYLYTTPPKYVLKDASKNLFESNLAPMAVVHFGSEEHREHYLSPAIVGQLGQMEDADQIVVKHMPTREPQPGSSGVPNTTKVKRSSSSQGPEEQNAAGATGGTKNVPKWFKIGKK